MIDQVLRDLAALDEAISIQRRIVAGMNVVMDYSVMPTALEIRAMHTWTKTMLHQLEIARQNLLELEKAYSGSKNTASK